LSQAERNRAQHAANGNGTLAMSTGLVAIAHATALEKFVDSLRSVRVAVAATAQVLGPSVADAATEGFVTAAWTKFSEGSKDEDVFIIPSGRDVLLNVGGSTTVAQFKSGEDLAGLVGRSLSIPISTLTKLAVYQDGRVGVWSDLVKADVHEVRVSGRLLGGANISRSERIINRITSAEGLQDTSRGALTAVLDPFHDAEYRVVGLPDSMASASVTELFKQTFTLTTAQGPTVNWDANIVLDPDVLTRAVAPYNRLMSDGIPTNKFRSAGPAFALAGGLVVYTSVAGVDQNMSIPTVALNKPTVPARVSSLVLGLSTPTVQGSYRVFGLSMEIENSTAPLYQQGNVVVWRQPMPNPSDSTTAVICNDGGAPYTAYASTLVIPQPPGSAAEAMLLAGSRQWHAKEGAMVISTPNSGEFPVLNSQCIATMEYEDDPSGVLFNGPNKLEVNGGGDPPIWAMPCSARTPFNQSGAYFTGLSPQTVLNINVRTWIEIFPSQISNPLTPLAQPSAPYDEVFWRIYSECIKDMPPGVMLKENGLGDWLSNIAGKVGNFISPIAKAVSSVASFIPHPAAQGIARVADMVGGVSERVGSSFGAPSSAQLRDDGVREAIQSERAIMRSESRVRAPKNSKAKSSKPRREIPTTALVKYKKR
jgi:hypothetical protein